MQHFSSSDIELTQMYKPYSQNLFSGLRQSLCQVYASNHAQIQDLPKKGICTFPFSDIELADDPWSKS